MPIRVLVVDDSAVTRGLMARALTADSDITVVGRAANGEAAIAQAKDMQPDVILLDIEMPVMDGLTALPLLLEAAPQSRILVASTLSARNAAKSMEALALGAADTLAKPSAQMGQAADDFFRDLVRKVHAVAHKPVPQAPQTAPVQMGGALNPMGTRALAIAASTGGPQALLSLFVQLKGSLTSVPIFVTQHMPPLFTAVLAQHLAETGARPCIEVKGGEKVQAGHAYLAPGDYHMLVEKQAGDIVLRITQDPPEHFCRPAADPMLRSLSGVYGPQLAVAILTGMGQDGLEGAREVVSRGGGVIAQDEASSVVYGMPKAVAEQRLCKAVLPLFEMGAYLIGQIDGRVTPVPSKAGAFRFFAELVKQRAGMALSEDKEYLIESRLLPVARQRHLPDVAALYAEASRHPSEELLTDITEAMTTNESFFFRDGKPYDLLRRTLLSGAMQARGSQRKLRIWSAACSTGQEPYSIALCLKEEAALLEGWSCDILATDIAGKVIDRARTGSYSQFEVQRGLPIQLLITYFSSLPDTSWQVNEEVRSMVQYRKHNLMDDYAALGTFDIIFCRNVLIYFDEATRAQITEKMARSLLPHGVLILGAAETLVDPGDRFVPIDGLHGAYRLRT